MKEQKEVEDKFSENGVNIMFYFVVMKILFEKFIFLASVIVA